MKKMILLPILALGFLLTSCSKEYTCECTTTQDFGDGNPIVSTATAEFTASSTKKAKEECEADVTQTLMGMTQTMKCTLK